MAQLKIKTMLLLLTLLLASFVAAAPNPRPRSVDLQTRQSPQSSYWLASIQRQGTVAYGSDPNFKIFRNIRDYGAKGDGVTDDTDAINAAITDGGRCGQGCDSSTTVPAIVYFPPGTYAVSKPIIQLYYTQFIGDAITLPTILALPSFDGLAVLDTDPYIPGANGAQWYTNQNNFYRQMRNLVIDLTKMPESEGACIHWQVAQATSLQNIVFNMAPKSPTNKQQGIFMDNGSGGWISDIVAKGGNFGLFLGNQQFTVRNVSIIGANTGIFLNWDWLFTFKSISIQDCDIGLDMSTLSGGVNQTVGSVVMLDSAMTNTPVGIKTSYNQTSLPQSGGTLALQNIDFSGTSKAIVGADGVSQMLAGGSIVAAWGQGDMYVPAGTPSGPVHKRSPQGPPQSTFDATSTTTLTVTDVPPPTGVWVTTTTVYVTASPSVPGSNTSSTILPITALSSSNAPTVLLNGTAAASGIQSRSTLPAISAPASCTATPVALQSANHIQQELSAPTLGASLMNGNKVFERSKPQYETVPVSSFLSLKSAGCKGDGVTDDTACIQNIFSSNSSAGKIVYFDHGAYVVSDTIKIPPNVRITGEMWPLLMVQGSAFQDVATPKPVFQIGQPGDVGSVEISDLIFETIGPAPGAIIMEWNIHESSQGAAAMWDTHFRIGGTAGTQLQQDVCQANVTGSFEFKPQCAGSFLLMHITQQASAYLENVWYWVADHELDITAHNQTDIFNGRGLLVESQGPVWLYGTSSEHNQLYNYQFSNARDVFMGAIQTETPYMQSSPGALQGGFPPNSAFNDPTFADCTDEACEKSWGLRIVDSSNIHMYGGGLYSFFDNYIQTCLDTESCQENMVDIQCSSNLTLWGLTTKASINIVNVDGVPQAIGKDHENLFGQTLLQFQL
jgi:glucan 1,3-beta-glucosidase